jgi:hypothetical protein
VPLPGPATPSWLRELMRRDTNPPQ